LCLCSAIFTPYTEYNSILFRRQYSQTMGHKTPSTYLPNPSPFPFPVPSFLSLAYPILHFFSLSYFFSLLFLFILLFLAHVEATQSIQAHPHAEVLSLDWNKYTPLTIHTSSNDRTLKTFDLRQPSLPLCTLQGHSLAVRKIAASPHDGRLLASASYDMTVRIWDWQQPGGGREVARWEGHSEFAYGVEWSLFGEGWVGSVGWDGRVFVSDWKREWKMV